METAITTGTCNKQETNSFEPKFKVGDWIASNDGVVTNNGESTFLITNINCGHCSLGDVGIISIYGSLEDTKGVVHYPCLLTERNFHHWTIEDAKEGDVLTYRLDNGKVLIMIYEGLGKSFDGEIYPHALLDGDGYFNESVGSVCCKFMELLTPATKEQRDLFFQKMKAVGYEWNSEKKELIKV